LVPKGPALTLELELLGAMADDCSPPFAADLEVDDSGGALVNSRRKVNLEVTRRQLALNEGLIRLSALTSLR
jgi:hypothetical protein